MADNYNRYSANGAAAYDAFAYDNAYAKPLPRHNVLPEEDYRPEEENREKVKAALAPFTLVGILTAACLMVLVIFGYVRLFEATSKVSRLQAELASVTEQKAVLQSKYEAKINLGNIQERAKALGMSKTSPDQIVYVNLRCSDNAEIFKDESISIFNEIADALKQSVVELVAYLRPFTA